MCNFTFSTSNSISGLSSSPKLPSYVSNCLQNGSRKSLELISESILSTELLLPPDFLSSTEARPSRQLPRLKMSAALLSLLPPFLFNDSMHLKNTHATDSKSLVLLKSSHADPDHHCLLQWLPNESLLSCLSISMAIIISTLPPLLSFMLCQGWDSVLLSLKPLRCFAPGLSQRQYLNIFILK